MDQHLCWVKNGLGGLLETDFSTGHLWPREVTERVGSLGIIEPQGPKNNCEQFGLTGL